MDRYTAFSHCVLYDVCFKGELVKVNSGYHWQSSKCAYILTKKIKLVICVISGFCHIENEFLALLGCYAMWMSGYWYLRTTVCPKVKGQAVQARFRLAHINRLDVLFCKVRHIHVIMSYFYRPDNWAKSHNKLWYKTSCSKTGLMMVMQRNARYLGHNER